MSFEPIAICQDYGCLAEALVGERGRLGWSQNELDARAGFQDGYTGKLESWRHPSSGRSAGPVILPLWLQALGVALVVVRVKDIEPKPRETKERPGEAAYQLELELVGGAMREVRGRVNRRADHRTLREAA